MVDAGHGKELAHLLEADFRFSPRDHGAHALAAFDAAALAYHLIRDSQPLI